MINNSAGVRGGGLDLIMSDLNMSHVILSNNLVGAWVFSSVDYISMLE